MKKLLIGMALAICSSMGTVKAQQNSYDENLNILKNNIWTDGFEFVKYISPFDASEVFDIPIALDDENTLLLYGGSLHEGGTCLFLKADGTSIVVNDEELHSWFPGGDKLEINNQPRILFIRDGKTHEVHGILKAVSQLGELKDMIQKNYVRLGLAGNYTDSTGKAYDFSSTERIAKGFPFADSHFEFGTINKVPQFILVFKEATYIVDQTANELQLIPVTYDKSCDTYRNIQEAEVIKMKRKTDRTVCEYPLLSKEYFTRSELAIYGGCSSYVSGSFKSEKRLKAFIHSLGIMKNEILARHGFIFTNKEWREYFGLRTWYKPQETDVTDKLNEFEKANIELIQQIEKKLTQQINEF